ncbi:glycerophosphodiester phosphodiesterase family protein [Marinibaculum pumilum]|uniref:Glycerophosphodiester phosphodiesterase family protein n=1 Tax=Marinibaculum pumilum TaxID=1766165 RepID=A0ABV7KWA2_9PROT
MILNPPDWLTAQPFAHRGLHRPGPERPENSLAAFAAARQSGFGIELDVQLSADGVPMVFHDADLKRLAGRPEKVTELPADALSEVTLADGAERIPTLAAVLAAIGPDAPLLVEVKAEGPEYRATAEAVGAVLGDSSPKAAVMSFHPGVVTWFAEAWPERIRGQVAMDRARYPEGFSGNRLDALMEMLRMRVGRPHFLAYDIRDLPSDLSTGYRHVGLPVLTWTVRSDAERARAAEAADTIIFEETA